MTDSWRVLTAWFERRNYFHKKTQQRTSSPFQFILLTHNRFKASLLIQASPGSKSISLCLSLGRHKNPHLVPAGSALSLEINQGPHHSDTRQALESALLSLRVASSMRAWQWGCSLFLYHSVWMQPVQLSLCLSSLFDLFLLELQISSYLLENYKSTQSLTSI